MVRLHRSNAARAEVDAEGGQEAGPLTLEELRDRLSRVEALVEELQDSLHRRAVRQDDEMDELQRRTDPSAMAQALAKDARARGL